MDKILETSGKKGFILQKREHLNECSLLMRNNEAESNGEPPLRSQEGKCQSRIMHPVKLPIKDEREIKSRRAKQRLKKCVGSRPACQELLEEVFSTKSKLTRRKFKFSGWDMGKYQALYRHGFLITVLNVLKRHKKA